MALSPYLQIFPHPTVAGCSVLFSARKGSFAVLPDTVLASLKEGCLADAELAALARLGLITDDPEAERALGRGLLDELNRLSPGLRVAVILTMDCNFECRYCYEGKLKNKRYMTEETAHQIVAFLTSLFQAGHRKLVLDFYGGEPLLARERLKQIAGPLKKFVEERDGEFHCTLVTNGSLLTRKTAEELKPFGLRFAKVTIDGPADLHDRSRPFKAGQGSFAVILRNLRECCDLVNIGVQGNYTRDNYHRFPELLDILAAEGLTPGRLYQATFNPIMQTNDEFALADFNDGCCSMGEPWVAEAALFLREETLRRGYRVPKITPTPCMIEINGTFTVHVDGSLYKCVGFVGHENYAVGDVWQGMADYRQVYNLNNWRDNAECRDCPYLPLCFGGCRYMEFQRQGAIEGVNCQKGLWDAALGKLVQQSVRWMQKKS